MCRKTNWLTLTALVVSLLVVGGLQAQTTTGRLIGTTTDNDGLGLPGVQVKITSDVLIGGPQNTVSDAQGNFQFMMWRHMARYQVRAGGTKTVLLHGAIGGLDQSHISGQPQVIITAKRE